MKTYKITYRTYQNRVKSIVVTDIDKMCAQLTVILTCNCEQILKVESV